MQDNYLNLLSEFAKFSGLDAEGLIETEELVIDGLTVCFHFDEQLHLYAALGKPHSDDLKSVYQVLLEANHFGIGTGGCLLGLTQETSVVTLTSRHDIDPLNAQSLAVLLDGFVNVAEYWIAFLENGKAQQIGQQQMSFALRG